MYPNRINIIMILTLTVLLWAGGLLMRRLPA